MIRQSNRKLLFSRVVLVGLMAWSFFLSPLPTHGQGVDSLINHTQLMAYECSNSTSIFSIPHWWSYLPAGPNCTVVVTEPKHFLLIGMAIIGMLTRIAGILATFYVVYGGIRYIMSQGEPEALAGAKNTITNALVGFIITAMAAAIVSFIAARIAG